MLWARRAFTLVELLVVIAIISIISAFLFPVLSMAKASANRASCVSNLGQIAKGVQMYAMDYDERMMPANHRPAGDANSRNDRTWVQSLLPYVRNFTIFRCPADNSNRPRLEATFDQDLVAGDTYSQYYSASLRSNYGYNYHNLSPIVQEGDTWAARPKLLAEVSSPSTTLVFVDSVWEQDTKGRPNGGGNWLIIPPCRYYETAIDSFTQSINNAIVYTPILGWSVTATSVGSDSPYGNAFPWHNGRMNVARLDGSVTNRTPAQLGVGCDVQNAWQGMIEDPERYMWDVR